MSWRHEQWTRRLQPRLLGYASVAGLLALTTLLSLTLPSSRAGQHNISSKRPAAGKGADGASASLQTARNVGKAYKELIRSWRDVLPASSMCLAVPIVPLSRVCWPDIEQPEQAQRMRTEKPATSDNPELA